MSYYESHITMLGTPETLKPLVEEIKWKFSAIDGDPVLGEGIKCYATMHHSAKHTIEDVISYVKAASQALRQKNIKILRSKVELVLYDTKRED